MDGQAPRSLVLPALILGIAIAGGLYLHGYVNSSNRSNDVISVTGSAKRRVNADLAKWSGTITHSTDINGVRATIAQLGTETQKVKTFATALGISEATIKINPVQTEPVYQNYPAPQSISGYNVRQDIKIESKDIDKLEALASSIKKLADDNITFSYQNTEYYFGGLAELRADLFAEATKDAQHRSEAIARGTGVKIGGLRSARTGVVQVLPPNSTEVNDYGAYDLSTKEKDVTATVNVSFALTH